MVALMVAVLVALLFILAVGSFAAWYCRPPASGNRQTAMRNEALVAEARIDALTRQTMQRMRDVVRDEQRGRGQVIEGDIVE